METDRQRDRQVEKNTVLKQADKQVLEKKENLNHSCIDVLWEYVIYSYHAQ